MMKITKGYEDIVEIFQGEMNKDEFKITVRTKTTKDTEKLMDLIKRLSNKKVWFTFNVKLGFGEE